MGRRYRVRVNLSYSPWSWVTSGIPQGSGHWSLKITTNRPPCLHLTSNHLSAVTHAPFHASVLRPASQVGLMHKTAGMGKLINAALLSLINEACVSVCCATLLLSQLVGSACVQARSSNPRCVGLMVLWSFHYSLGMFSLQRFAAT